MKRCSRCNTGLPPEARFCWQCGAPQPELVAKEPIADCVVDLEADLLPQLNQLFLLALKDRMEREHLPGMFPIYSERLYLSGFRDEVSERLQELAQLIAEMKEQGEANSDEINMLTEDLLEELLDKFIVVYCKDLNETIYPEAILRYKHASRGQVPLGRLILDYLELAESGIEFYTDLLRMPIEKLQMAGKTFLFPAPDEKILLVADQSVLGTGKEGFAFTDVGLYWKAPMEKPRFVRFANLRELKRVSAWMVINGFFFNVNPAVNANMLRLLNRLRRLYRDTEMP